jgi:hypothetical protein
VREDTAEVGGWWVEKNNASHVNHGVCLSRVLKLGWRCKEFIFIHYLNVVYFIMIYFIIIDILFISNLF